MWGEEKVNDFLWRVEKTERVEKSNPEAFLGGTHFVLDKTDASMVVSKYDNAEAILTVDTGGWQRLRPERLRDQLLPPSNPLGLPTPDRGRQPLVVERSGRRQDRGEQALDQDSMITRILSWTAYFCKTKPSTDRKQTA